MEEAPKYSVNSQAAGVPNPANGGIQVVVTIPERITIKMVDATQLGAYEYHAAVSAALLGITVGFLVPAIQESRSGSPLGTPFTLITVFFVLLLGASFIMTLVKRHDVRKGGKEIELQTSGARLHP